MGRHHLRLELDRTFCDAHRPHKIGCLRREASRIEFISLETIADLFLVGRNGIAACRCRDRVDFRPQLGRREIQHQLALAQEIFLTLAGRCQAQNDPII